MADIETVDVFHDEYGSIEFLQCRSCRGSGKFHSPAVGKYVAQFFQCPSCTGDGTLKREIETIRAKPVQWRWRYATQPKEG